MNGSTKKGERIFVKSNIHGPPILGTYKRSIGNLKSVTNQHMLRIRPAWLHRMAWSPCTDTSHILLFGIFISLF